MTQYERVIYIDGERIRSCWAEHVVTIKDSPLGSVVVFDQVDSEGTRRLGHIVSEEMVVSRRPAKMDLHYGTLRVDRKATENEEAT